MLREKRGKTRKDKEQQVVYKVHSGRIVDALYTYSEWDGFILL